MRASPPYMIWNGLTAMTATATMPATPRDRIHHAKSARADTLKTSDGARRRKASAPARASGRRRR